MLRTLLEWLALSIAVGAIAYYAARGLARGRLKLADYGQITLVFGFAVNVAADTLWHPGSADAREVVTFASFGLVALGASMVLVARLAARKRKHAEEPERTIG